jgi:hypothetical protein
MIFTGWRSERPWLQVGAGFVRSVLVMGLGMLLAQAALAQSANPPNPSETPAYQMGAIPADPQIEAALKQVSAQHIQARECGSKPRSSAIRFDPDLGTVPEWVCSGLRSLVACGEQP